ncbi:molecular chaperone DnaJ [Halocalculus aciditolerans]|uniref:CR-type domain-containing protein n=1 Tax=Halocalculus aciditolerans TaxID=1383812 RepID=A0A830F2B9_9EURY|nr:hypothetical protein [Halocalculus aciditolerans]GGL55638.1 hypothetical protein GCM10009039_12290 [Halocalculus aciditolerans]
MSSHSHRRHGSGTGGPSIDDDSRDDTGDHADARRLLASFADDWKVADDLAERANIHDVVHEDVEKQVETDLRADDRVQTREFTVDEYETAVGEQAALDARFEEAPERFQDRSVSFVDYEVDPTVCSECRGDTTVECTRCTGGEVECPDCSGRGSQNCSCGDGTVDCQGCHGSGRVHPHSGETECDNCAGDGDFRCPNCDGVGKFQCPDCGGDGRQQCPTCDGTEKVTCEHCDGEGETYEAKAGTVDFSVEENTRVISDHGMPSQRVREASGVKRDEQTASFDPPIEGGTGVVRKTTEYFDVPTTKVEYTLDGDAYELYDVDGETHAPAYPKSQYYEYAPYVAAVGGVFMLAFLLAQSL